MVSALVGRIRMMTDEVVLVWTGRVFKSQTCLRECVRLHIAVVMQALIKLAENVLLYMSDHRVYVALSASAHSHTKQSF